MIERALEKIVMQGYENGRAFSAVLGEDGRLTLGTAIEGTTFTVFGRCTDLKLVTDAGK